MKKLQYIKKSLLEWNNKFFGRLTAKKNEIWNDIHVVENMVDKDGIIPSGMMDKKKELLANLEVILKCEDIH